MEFRLTFKEKEIRALYGGYFEAWNNGLQNQLKAKRNRMIIGLGLTILALSLTSFHFDWIYYAAFFFGVTVVYGLIFWRERRKIDNETGKWKDEVERFFKKYEHITDIKYTYDSERIQYFEHEKLTFENSWKDLIHVDKNEKEIYLYFKSPAQNFWFPRVTVDKDDLDCFERAIDDRFQNVRVR